MRVIDRVDQARVGLQVDQLLADPAFARLAPFHQIHVPPVLVERHVAKYFDHFVLIHRGGQQVAAAGAKAATGHLHIDDAGGEAIGRGRAGGGRWRLSGGGAGRRGRRQAGGSRSAGGQRWGRGRRYRGLGGQGAAAGQQGGEEDGEC